ncbi:hypothetical protein Q8W67_08475 [Methylobacterium sp. NEAU K]|nr:hypothetical protein [Methylobacterium sp. NEAU K]MDP4003500.1 hypothetical protein [Methylobacterium sp. NEAU K]
MRPAIDRNPVVELAMMNQVRSEFEDPYVGSDLRRGPAAHRLPTQCGTSDAERREEADGGSGIVRGYEVADRAQIRSRLPRHEDRLRVPAFSQAVLRAADSSGVAS